MEFLKSSAKALYDEGKYLLALETYQKCQELAQNKEELLTLSKNITACLVKMEKYEEAIKQCLSILATTPLDPKTLYRYACCLNKVGRYEDSASTLKTLLKVQGNNKLVNNLMKEVISKNQENAVSVDKLTDIVQMMKDGSDLFINIKKLHYLGSYSQNCRKIVLSGGVEVLFSLIKSANYGEDIRIAACHCLRDLCLKSVEISQLTFDWLVVKLNFLVKADISNDMVDSIWGLCDSLIQNSSELVTKFTKVVAQYIDSNRLGVFGRNRLLLFLMKHLKGSPTFELIDQTEMVEKVLTLLGVNKTNNLVLVDNSTPDLVKSLLSTVYEGLRNENQTKIFKKQCVEYTNSFLTTINELGCSHVASVDLISALFQSVPDVASEILSTKDSLVDAILMLSEDDPLITEIISILDCLIGCISIKKLALAHSDSIYLCFRKHFESNKSESVRIRALVGLCKALSIEGFLNSLSEDTKYSLNYQGITKCVLDVLSGRGHSMDDLDLINYSLQALLFLSLSADSKELLCEDESALEALVKSANKYSYLVSQILVNLTNSYDQTEMDEHMKKLAQFAREKIPEKHPKDSEEYVDRRVDKLVKVNVFKSLRLLSSAKSDKVCENVSRVFLRVLRQERHRGLCAQMGCIRSLLELSREFNLAAQALARVGITSNPTIIFPDQIIFQVVGPFVRLLCISMTPLQNYEGLLALGNLASVDDDVRRCIMRHKGFYSVETCMFSENPRIRLAATQCMCNMAMLDDVVALFAAPGNDRVKLLVIFVGFLEEEGSSDLILDLVSAASGALAILSADEAICRLICNVSHWEGRMISALAGNVDGVTHRVLSILRNLCHYRTVRLCPELAELVQVLSTVKSSPIIECALDIVNLIN